MLRSKCDPTPQKLRAQQTTGRAGASEDLRSQQQGYPNRKGTSNSPDTCTHTSYLLDFSPLSPTHNARAPCLTAHLYSTYRNQTKRPENKCTVRGVITCVLKRKWVGRQNYIASCFQASKKNSGTDEAFVLFGFGF